MNICKLHKHIYTQGLHTCMRACKYPYEHCFRVSHYIICENTAGCQSFSADWKMSMNCFHTHRSHINTLSLCGLRDKQKNSGCRWINISPTKTPELQYFILLWNVTSNFYSSCLKYRQKIGRNICKTFVISLTTYGNVLIIKLFCFINSHGILRNDQQEFVHTGSALLFTVIKYRFLCVPCIKNLKE